MQHKYLNAWPWFLVLALSHKLPSDHSSTVTQLLSPLFLIGDPGVMGMGAVSSLMCLRVKLLKFKSYNRFM